MNMACGRARPYIRTIQKRKRTTSSHRAKTGPKTMTCPASTSPGQTVSWECSGSKMWPASDFPLFKLVHKATESEYQLTPKEKRIFDDYLDESARGQRRGYVIGGVIGGAVAWALTRRVKVPEGSLDVAERFGMRIAGTLIGGMALGAWNMYHAVGRCEERLAFMEDSPLQGELIAILQEGHPNSALLKRYFKQRTTQGVTYDVEGKIILNRLPVVNRQLAVNEQPSDQRTFANFYKPSTWNKAEDSGNAGSSQERAAEEKRRSRMTAEERRSYNREQP